MNLHHLSKPISPILSSRQLRQWFLNWLSTVDWQSLVVFLLPFVLYLKTLAPTIYNLDSAELTTAAATGGLVRATGYPLYLLIGQLWAKLPIGDVGYRFNLLSALFSAGTLLISDHILRQQKLPSWARWGAIGLLATAPYFWIMSLVAEVYTLHTFLVAAIIWYSFRWQKQPTRLGLIGAVLLTAISLGNHAATILLLPALIFLVISTTPRLVWQPRTVLGVVSAGILGLSLYLFLSWRYLQTPTFNYVGHYDASGTFIPTNLLNLQNLFWLMTGRSFAGQMMGYTPTEIWQETHLFLQELGRSFLAIGIGPGLVGMVGWIRRDWRQGVMLLLIFAGNAIFYINYRVVDKNTMFLPNYLIWALWAGLGYQIIFHWLQTENHHFSRTAQKALQFLTLLAVVVALSWNWAIVDQSQDWSSRQQGEAIFQQLQPNAIIFGWWDTIPVLEYLQQVEGQRPDVTLINRFLISGDNMTQLIADQIDTRPIYINAPPPEYLQQYRAVKVGYVYQLYSRPPYPSD